MKNHSMNSSMKKGEAEGRKSKGEGGGGDPISYFFSALDFLAAFLIFPPFSRLNQPERSVRRL